MAVKKNINGKRRTAQQQLDWLLLLFVCGWAAMLSVLLLIYWYCRWISPRINRKESRMLWAHWRRSALNKDELTRFLSAFLWSIFSKPAINSSFEFFLSHQQLHVCALLSLRRFICKSEIPQQKSTKNSYVRRRSICLSHSHMHTLFCGTKIF